MRSNVVSEVESMLKDVILESFYRFPEGEKLGIDEMLERIRTSLGIEDEVDLYEFLKSKLKSHRHSS